MDNRGVNLRAFLSNNNTDDELRKLIAHLADSANKIAKKIGEIGRDEAGSINSYGERQMKLDVWADKMILGRLSEESSFGVREYASEERDEVAFMGTNRVGKSGRYSVTADPLDGSSLIKPNLTIGSIFGIHDGVILSGRPSRKSLVAAMYAVYGPTTTLVVGVDGKTHEFILDDSRIWVLKKEDIKIVEKPEGESRIYSPGGLENEWTQQHEEFIRHLRNEGFKLRYSGALVADINQILVYGGAIFSYPGLRKKPEGKLRLIFEEQPMALLGENAGGRATDGINNILDKVPTKLDQRSPFYWGSRTEVGLAKEYLEKRVA